MSKSKYVTKAKGYDKAYNPKLKSWEGGQTIMVSSKEEMQQVQQDLLNGTNYSGKVNNNNNNNNNEVVTANPSGSTSSKQAVAEAQGQTSQEIKNKVAYKNYVENLKQRGFTQQQIDTYKPETVQEIQQYQNQNTQETIGKYNEARMQELLQEQARKLKDAREKTIQQQYIEKGIYTPDVINSKYERGKQENILLNQNKNVIVSPYVGENTSVPKGTEIKMYAPKFASVYEQSPFNKKKEITPIMVLTGGISEGENNPFVLRGKETLLNNKEVLTGKNNVKGSNDIEPVIILGAYGLKQTSGLIHEVVGHPIKSVFSMLNPSTYVETGKSILTKTSQKNPEVIVDIGLLYGTGKVIGSKTAKQGVNVIYERGIKITDTVIETNEKMLNDKSAKVGGRSARERSGRITNVEKSKMSFNQNYNRNVFFDKGEVGIRVRNEDLKKQFISQRTIRGNENIKTVTDYSSISKDRSGLSTSYLKEGSTLNFQPKNLNVPKKSKQYPQGYGSQSLSDLRETQRQYENFNTNSQSTIKGTMVLQKIERTQQRYNQLNIKRSPIYKQEANMGKQNLYLENKPIEEGLNKNKSGDLILQKREPSIVRKGWRGKIFERFKKRKSEEVKIVKEEVIPKVEQKKELIKINEVSSMDVLDLQKEVSPLEKFSDELSSESPFGKMDLLGKKKKKQTVFYDIDYGMVGDITNARRVRTNRVENLNINKIGYNNVIDITGRVLEEQKQFSFQQHPTMLKGYFKTNVDSKLNTELKTETKTDITSKMVLNTKLNSGLKIDSKLNTSQGLINKEIQKEKQIQSLETPQMITITPTFQQLQTPLKPEPIPSYVTSYDYPKIEIPRTHIKPINPEPRKPTIPIIVIPTPLKPKFPIMFPKFGEDKQQQKVKGYNVYMKEYKKVVKANEKPLPYTEAVRLGQDVADNSLSASYKVSDARVNVNKATRSKYATNNFNPNNFVKSSKQTGWFIEKKGARLDSAGERKGITASKLLAQRKKAMMQNKVIKLGF